MSDSGADRPARIGERIRQELMQLLLRGDVKDPRVQGAVVHAVKVTGDLREARIYVRLGLLDPSKKQQRALITGLSRAAGFLRRELGARLRTKVTPELSFVWDETSERAGRIEVVLDELRAERAAAEEQSESEAPDDDAGSPPSPEGGAEIEPS